jgi:hypothetical protein
MATRRRVEETSGSGRALALGIQCAVGRPARALTS